MHFSFFLFLWARLKRWNFFLSLNVVISNLLTVFLHDLRVARVCTLKRIKIRDLFIVIAQLIKPFRSQTDCFS